MFLPCKNINYITLALYRRGGVIIIVLVRESGLRGYIGRNKGISSLNSSGTLDCKHHKRITIDGSSFITIARLERSFRRLKECSYKGSFRRCYRSWGWWCLLGYTVGFRLA